jgi:hypothetical protein
LPNIEVLRTALKARRRSLEEDTEALRVATQRLGASEDVAALHAHSVRLDRHRAAVAAFTADLHAFHRDFGPLGD